MSNTFDDDLYDEESGTRNVAIANREALEKGLNNIWGHSTLGIEAKKAAMAMLSTKNGMYARIPLICKGENCPYAESCMLLSYDLVPVGEPCPKETAEIELRYMAYGEDFEIDTASFTDKNLISELINYDVMLDRLRALLSKEQVLVVDVITGITEQGEEFTHPEVSKTWEAYERVEKKRNAVYDLMLATRRSTQVKGAIGEGVSITQMVSSIMEAEECVVDVKPENIE